MENFNYKGYDITIETNVHGVSKCLAFLNGEFELGTIDDINKSNAKEKMIYKIDHLEEHYMKLYGQKTKPKRP